MAKYMKEYRGYRFLEGLTLADVAFEATGKTLDELFKNAALALFDINVDIKSVKKKSKKSIKLSAENIEQLMFKFLDELIFLKDKFSVVFSDCKVKVKEQKNNYSLEATLYGDKIDPEKQKLGVDAKAVTMHMFEVKKDGNIYKARIIIDI